MRTRLRHLLLALLLVLAVAAPASAQTVFGANNAAIIWGGLHTFASNVSGRSCYEMNSLGCEMDVTVHGTQCVLSFYAQKATDLTFQVDGGTVTNPTLTTGSWQTYTIFTGLSDTNHTLVIKSTTSSYNGSFTLIDYNSALTVTSSAAALSLPSWASQNIYFVQSASGFTHDGSMSNVTINNNPSWSGSQDCTVRFFVPANSGITAIWVWRYCGGDKYRFAVDWAENGTLGSTASSQTIPNTSTWQWVEVASGLDGVGAHQYMLTWVGKDSSAVSSLYEIMTVGGTPELNPPVPIPLVAAYGDSITQAWLGTSNDSGVGYCHLLALWFHWSVRNLGYPGSTVAYLSGQGAAQTTYAGEYRTSAVTSLAPPYCIVEYIHNDASLGTSIETVGTFQAAEQSMMQQLTSAPGMQNTIFYVLDDLPTTDATTNSTYPGSGLTYMQTFSNAQATALATLGLPRVYYFHTAGWFNASTQTADGTHPTASGYLSMFNQMEPLIAARLAVPQRHSPSGRYGSRSGRGD